MSGGEIVSLVLFILAFAIFAFAFTGPVRHTKNWVSPVLIVAAVFVMTVSALVFTLTHKF